MIDPALRELLPCPFCGRYDGYCGTGHGPRTFAAATTDLVVLNYFGPVHSNVALPSPPAFPAPRRSGAAALGHRYIPAALALCHCHESLPPPGPPPFSTAPRPAGRTPAARRPTLGPSRGSRPVRSRPGGRRQGRVLDS